MKMLVATNKTQGTRKNDFFSAEEGEPVLFPTMECERGTVDDKCGCKRSMCGLYSRKATTTIEVVEATISRDELLKRVRNMIATSWGEELVKYAEDFVEENLQIANQMPVGSVLERRGSKISTRISN
jgi:hypothetical protein